MPGQWAMASEPQVYDVTIKHIELAEIFPAPDVRHLSLLYGDWPTQAHKSDVSRATFFPLASHFFNLCHVVFRHSRYSLNAICMGYKKGVSVTTSGETFIRVSKHHHVGRDNNELMNMSISPTDGISDHSYPRHSHTQL